jgi:hypothetical protein
LVFAAAGLLGFGGLVQGTEGQESGRLGAPPTEDAMRPSRGFHVDVLVHGRPLGPDRSAAVRVVRALEGADYELRINNPLSARVAVALSVDGLNTIDAGRAGAWDASKWLIRPYESITVSGWQVGTERARRFYFTRESDSYAAKLGRSGDFGVIRAVFFRERQPRLMITPPPGESFSAHGAQDRKADPSAGPAPSYADRADREHDRRPWWEDDGAATGMGRSERSEVSVVHMALEPQAVATVEIRYTYNPSWYGPEPIPLRGHPLPAPFQRDPASRPEDLRFCPEP